MHIKFPQVVAALIAACTCNPTGAATYRWVDENGVTVYSQSPPPSGDAVTLKKPPPASQKAADAARENLRLEREKAFDEEEDRKAAEAEKAKQAEEEAQGAANCAAARDNLEKFQNLGPRMIRTPDGRVLRLSEDEVQMQVTKALRQVETYCK